MNDGAPKLAGSAKLIIAAVMGALLMLFALQNMARVDLTFLFWTFEARRIVVIALSFVVGFSIGWLVKTAKRTHPE